MITKVPVPASAFEAFRAERLEFAALLRRIDVTPLPHDRVLACRLASAFEQGVARLEPYPDDDPRWRLRLPRRSSQGWCDSDVEYLLERRLQICPNDDELRWLLIAPLVYLCDNGFAAHLLSPLVIRDPMNLRWLIASAVWVNALSGVDTAASLREELLLLKDVIPDIARHLERLREADNAHARWIGRIGICGYETGTYGEAPSIWRGFPEIP